jgi:hypothetical protein
MPWVLFALAIGAIAIAFRTYSIGLAALCLLAALVLIIVGALKLAAARLSSVSRNETRMLDPKLVHSMREKAKKDGSTGVAAGGGSDGARSGREKSGDGESGGGDGPRSTHDAAGDGGGDGGGGD